MDYLYMQPVTGCLFYKYTQFAMMGIILDLKGLNNLGDFCMLQTRPDMLEMKFLHSLTHGTSYTVSSCLL